MLKKIKNNKVKRLENTNMKVLSDMRRVYESKMEYERMAEKYRRIGNRPLYNTMMRIIEISDERLGAIAERHSEIFDKIEKLRN